MSMVLGVLSGRTSLVLASRALIPAAAAVPCHYQQYRTKFTNPLTKGKKVRVDTTFVSKRKSVPAPKPLSKEEDVVYRKAQIMKNIKQTKAWIPRERKEWVYDRLLNVFHIFAVCFVIFIIYQVYQDIKLRYKLLLFSKTIQSELAEELELTEDQKGSLKK